MGEEGVCDGSALGEAEGVGSGTDEVERGGEDVKEHCAWLELKHGCARRWGTYGS